MKIGYPCMNYSLGEQSVKTFKLASFSSDRFHQTLKHNLIQLKNILEYNLRNQLMFFRISSEIVPFASHPIMTINWQEVFKEEIESIGSLIKKYQMRISMHPDQFVLINSPKKDIVEKSIKDLAWHCQLLDLMGLDQTAKVQIHVGGVYGNKEEAITRFINNYQTLSKEIKKRLVIENDDKSYSLKDCLRIHQKIGIPILFDNFHHECLNDKESLRDAAILASKTWSKKDGAMMVDYSSQQQGAIKGKHIDSIDSKDFKRFLNHIAGIEMDIMLEIKDKEQSALKAIKLKPTKVC